MYTGGYFTSINVHICIPVLDILVELVYVVAHADDSLGHGRHLLFRSHGCKALDAAHLA